MKIMLGMVDKVFLLTGSTGTTVVLEQSRDVDIDDAGPALSFRLAYTDAGDRNSLRS